MAWCRMTRWLFTAEDSAVQRLRKQVLLALLCGTILHSVVQLAAYRARGGADGVPVWMMATACAALVLSVGFIVAMTWTRRVSDVLLALVIGMIVLETLSYDLLGLSEGGARRGWVRALLVLPCAVALSGGRWLLRGVVAVVGAYLFAVSFEGALRYGLYDLPGLWPAGVRRERLCGCAAPPCADGRSSLAAWWALHDTFVLAVSGVVVWVRMGQDVSGAHFAGTMRAVGDIADSLGDLDFETAARRLNGAAHVLPTDLNARLRRLLHTLEIYRPFLPESLFEEECGATALVAPPIPDTQILSAGVGEVQTAIVFTDIRSSSTLWRACPAAMQIALRTHNRVIRRCMHTHGGYEVKTIGDAFMVALPSLANAVQFGMDVQEGLLAAPWPADILVQPACAPHGDVWGGLAIRVGAAYGAAAAEQSELTGRWDFFGSTVNCAARLESAALVGSIAVLTGDFDARCGDSDFPYTAIDTSKRELRGVYETEGGTLVTCLVPPALAGRAGMSHRSVVHVHSHQAHALARVPSRAGDDHRSVTSLQRCISPPVFDDVDSMGGSKTASEYTTTTFHTMHSPTCIGTEMRSVKSFGGGEVATPLAMTAPQGHGFLTDSATIDVALRPAAHVSPPRAALPLMTVSSCVVGAVCIDVAADPLASGDPSGTLAAPAVSTCVTARGMERVQMLLTRTSGSVATVCGTMVLVSWGVVRRTVSHLDDAYHFARLAVEGSPVMQSSVREDTPSDADADRATPKAVSTGAITPALGFAARMADELEGGSAAPAHRMLTPRASGLRTTPPPAPPVIHVGLCAGAVQYGTVGMTQRFWTLVGRPTNAAMALCGLSEQSGVRALYGACTARHCPARVRHSSIPTYLVPYPSGSERPAARAIAALHSVHSLAPAAVAGDAGLSPSLSVTVRSDAVRSTSGVIASLPLLPQLRLPNGTSQEDMTDALDQSVRQMLYSPTLLG